MVSQVLKAIAQLEKAGVVLPDGPELEALTKLVHPHLRFQFRLQLLLQGCFSALQCLDLSCLRAAASC